MTKSAPPWTSTRCSTGNELVNSALPAISPQLQPTPMSVRPLNSPVLCAASVLAASSAPTNRISPPRMMTVCVPSRSTSHPTTGEKAYIPRMCSEITSPITAKSWSPLVMCSGVAVITVTITIWPTSMASRASRASGRAAIRRITVAGDAGRGASEPIVPSTSSGSGRSPTWVMASPARNMAELST